MGRDVGIGVSIGLVILGSAGFYFYKSASTNNDKVAVERFNDSVKPPAPANANAARPPEKPAPQPAVQTPMPKVATANPTAPPTTNKSVAVLPPFDKPSTGLPNITPGRLPVAGITPSNPGGTASSRPASFQPPVNTPPSVATNPPSSTPPTNIPKPAADMPKGPVTHMVESGETLSEIAQRYYNDPMAYKALLKANPSLKDANAVRPGMKIVIPDRATVASGMTHGGATVAAPASRPAARLASTAEKPIPAGYYRVAKGDTLETIAKNVVGDRKKWKEIYELNRHAIGADPERLKQGTLLKLPAKSAATRPTISK